ncbi:MAG: hypothetical protein C4518_19835 [Desulfobacteraceae bacterium]|nr:MAG: hypothetical protein C4518_19835 [Desulfobacteraceae bacterium]
MTTGCINRKNAERLQEEVSPVSFFALDSADDFRLSITTTLNIMHFHSLAAARKSTTFLLKQGRHLE